MKVSSIFSIFLSLLQFFFFLKIYHEKRNLKIPTQLLIRNDNSVILKDIVELKILSSLLLLGLTLIIEKLPFFIFLDSFGYVLMTLIFIETILDDFWRQINILMLINPEGFLIRNRHWKNQKKVFFCYPCWRSRGFYYLDYSRK